jgi:hypothetical protein
MENNFSECISRENKKKLFLGWSTDKNEQS